MRQSRMVVKKYDKMVRKTPLSGNKMMLAKEEWVRYQVKYNLKGRDEMLMILSPAKTYKEENVSYSRFSSELPFHHKTKELVTQLQSYSIEELAQLMKMSQALGELNNQRFAQFYDDVEQALLGIHAFEGEAYKGLDSLSLSEEALQLAQQNLLILSGLYGVIHPFDWINPYRLEMATRLSNSAGKDLYAFWKGELTAYVMNQIGKSQGEKILLNLASTEYSKVLDLKQIRQSYPVITIEFRERKGDTYKVIGMYAKRARGMMARHILQNHIKTLEEVRGFNEAGYLYNEMLSSDQTWVFTR